MRVMVIVKATKESDEQSLPIDMKADAEAFEAMGKFNDELTRAGVMVIASGLKPPASGSGSGSMGRNAP